MTEFPGIDALLDDRSYHIEFNGHLTNHSKHAVVALARLGANPAQIRAYYENYAHMTTYGFGLEPARGSSTSLEEEGYGRLLGMRKQYDALYDYFDRKEREYGLDSVLQEHLPLLITGWAGAFTHATIHLGFGLDIGNRCMILEGLAYMAYTYVDCHPERIEDAFDTPADATPAESLLRLAGHWRTDGEALRAWASAATDMSNGPAAGIHPELFRSGLQYRIATTLEAGHPLMYQAPHWLSRLDADACWDLLHYAAVLLYLSQPGDFVLLHLITSLHAMEQIAARLPHHMRKNVVRCYWVALVGIVFSGADFPKQRKLEALHGLFQTDSDQVDAPWIADEWNRIVARAFLEEEEHNPKLVYVMRRLWNRSGGLAIYRTAAMQFTLTPKLPPSFEQPPAE